MLRKADQQILVKYENDPLCGFDRGAFTEVLRKKLTGRVLEAWFFGSFTGKDFNRDSDIDLILVCDTDLPFPERNRSFDDIYDIGPEMDILVYKKEEFDKIRSNPPAGFWKSVIETMKPLIQNQ